MLAVPRVLAFFALLALFFLGGLCGLRFSLICGSLKPLNRKVRKASAKIAKKTAQRVKWLDITPFDKASRFLR